MKSLRIVILFSIVAFIACSKSGTNTTTPPNPIVPPPPVTLQDTPVTLYILGEDMINGHNIEKYWKDSLSVILADTTVSEHMSSIVVVGNDVYVSGTKYVGGYSFAEYYKNGVRIQLSDTMSYAAGIAVSGNDIYVCGLVTNLVLGKTYGRIWKNGVPTDLPGKNSKYVWASGLTISGSDIYVSGFELNPDSSNYIYIAKYWKNGTPVVLTDGTKNAQTSSIFVSGNDVYVAGFEAVQGTNAIAKYWKNGSPVILSDGSAAATLTGIVVDGSDVYCSGNMNDLSNSNQIGRYWKNGNMITLLQGASTNSTANGIAVFEKNVYVAGSEAYLPRYWKNGTPVDLMPKNFNSRATGIVVVKK